MIIANLVWSKFETLEVVAAKTMQC